MIRNIVAYPLPHGWPHSAAATAEFLQRRQFVGCGQLDMQHTGFVPPRDEAELCEPIAGRYLICHQHEEKILPASVVNEHVEIKRDEFERLNRYKPGRRQLKEMKEDVIAELLPQAFSKKRRTLAWINKDRGWLIVDASSAKRAEDVLDDMRKAFETLPVETLTTEINPARAMLQWMADNEAPALFTIDTDCELVSYAEDEGVVRYSNWDLAGEDVRYQLSIGRAPTMLGLTFDNRVSFIMTNRLELKRILLADAVITGLEESDDAVSKFDADFTLAAAEIELALDALVNELGGLARKNDGDLLDAAEGLKRDASRAFATLADTVTRDGASMTITTGDGRVLLGAGNEHDPLYPDAKRIVQENRRASISLIQRHLRIGYNHAARLIEQMEADGLVSALGADGTREVLAA